MRPVISAPARNEIQRGAMLLNPIAGATTLAAMFVVSVAIESATIDTMTMTGLSKRDRRSTGSHGAPSTTRTSRNRSAPAQVAAIPMKAKSVIVVGSPRTCPQNWSAWFRA